MRNNKKKIIIMLIIAITFLTLFVVWGLNAKNYRFNLSLRIPVSYTHLTLPTIYSV